MKVWNKVNPGTTDVHGNPILQKYATESEVITITAGSKRTEVYNAPPTLKYANVYLQRGHNHH